ncbi:UNVERIFIED_ORG: type IV secretion system protein VirB2 [Agrobacterium larrymoorei]|uniref:Type VI secretion protein n=2 Tax=Rhizobium/Agrobacterium group TaxID=227290 RepID=A0AA92BZ90_RHIRH|nr:MULTISPECIES: TrbC/VirB2 family protein [Rhizobium/Agrobacterium group]MDP9573838.1 type IV secretion system protein VirB2 [Agrobacterium larrymoorei]PVE62576.1 type VI secretion protein [Agrobacterium tumefaciens]PVE70714.1 type VI secretion protein [Sphingomonas sp. TPD3009]PVE50163.1 type VI secretion protein [Rhizobium rhizogenes]TBN14824.1 type VI secretion protein [Agrobacterium cavarae]
MTITHRLKEIAGSSRNRQIAIHGMALAVMLIGQADLALAAGDVFQPIQSVFTTLLNFMTGTFATTAATIACAAVGYLALTSRIPWSWCFSIIVGIAFIFGGSQLVASMQSGLGG